MQQIIIYAVLAVVVAILLVIILLRARRRRHELEMFPDEPFTNADQTFERPEEQPLLEETPTGDPVLLRGRSNQVTVELSAEFKIGGPPKFTEPGARVLSYYHNTDAGTLTLTIRVVKAAPNNLKLKLTALPAEADESAPVTAESATKAETEEKTYTFQTAMPVFDFWLELGRFFKGLLKVFYKPAPILILAAIAAFLGLIIWPPPIYWVIVAIFCAYGCLLGATLHFRVQ